MITIDELKAKLGGMKTSVDDLRDALSIEASEKRLAELEHQMTLPGFYDDQARSQKIISEMGEVKNKLERFGKLKTQYEEAETLLEMIEEENDPALAAEGEEAVEGVEKSIDELQLMTMLNGEYDHSNAILTFHAGTGGTEAQDWAEILLRMYLRWCESRGWKTELMEVSGGDVAGIKSATFRVEGEFAYGWLKTEIGVHRLVRKSPFDSDNRRHTSFTSVFVSPEVDDNIEIDINPADLRTDVYRSSGAGGQHVNKTESAVRITHIPTNTVVACQTGRSQHQNRDTAMKMLAAKLYELEVQKRNSERDALEATKSDIGWGSQIRNYVLDQSRIKDLRTGVERTDTQKVLDGDLDEFIEASLKSGLEAGAKRSDA